jgi:hypothetical protein
VLGLRLCACRLHDDRWGALLLNVDAATRSFLTLPIPETNHLRWQQGPVGSRPLPGNCSTSASRSLLDCALRTNAFLMAFFCRVHLPQAPLPVSSAVARLLDYAFGELDLHRVYAITDQENEPLVALLERLGLRREGEFVENAWFKGRWSSECLYAILRDEWLHRPREDADKGPQGETT